MAIDFDKLIAHAKKLGADEVEFYSESAHDTSITAAGGQLLSVSDSDIAGVGVRVIADRKLGFSYTGDVSGDGIKSAIAEAIDLTSAAEPDGNNVLPHADKVETDERFYEGAIVDTPVQDKVDKLLPIHERVQALDDRITGTSEVMYIDRTRDVRIVNSSGVDQQQKQSGLIMFAEVLARGEDESQSAYVFATGRSLEAIEDDELLKKAVWEAVSMLGAKSLSSRSAPVIMSAYSSVQLLMILSDALSAESVQRGRSMFVDRVGTRVASDKLTITDDPFMEQGLRSQFFDGEGVPCQRREIISRGILETLMYDTYTARKDGVESTGNGNRISYKMLPSASASNLIIEPGDKSRAELMKMAGTGLYVTQVFGMFSGVDQVGGNMSVGVGGLWFENGEFAYPVRGVTIASDLYEFLNNVVATGDDLLTLEMRGSFGAPSILIEEMAISGS